MNVVDLFSGCGGISLGFQKAGFDVVAAFDNWQLAIEVYKKNFNHPIFLQDLSNEKESIQNIKKFAPEIIVGGPPCQDFSSAGKRDIRLGRANLTYNFAKIVNSIKPLWFVMENVLQIRKSHILHEIIEQLSSNFGLTSVILDASYCNVPQNRIRFFLIGQLNGYHNSLLPILKNNLAEKQMTVRQYLGDIGTEYYYRHPRNYCRRSVYSVNEPSATIRGVNRPIPKEYKMNSCDPKGINIKEVRPLTTIERSLVQTFPNNFIWIGAKTNLEQMIGNAVPVNLASYVANCIREFQQTQHKKQTLLDTVDTFLLAERKLKP